MEEFWAICEMVLVTDDEGSSWTSDIAARYGLAAGWWETQSGPLGNPAPGYCLVHGWADAAIVEEVRRDAAIDIIE